MVTIEFTTDNAAFHSATHESFGDEIARILLKLAGIAEGKGQDQLSEEYLIMDVNDSAVGTMKISE